MTTDEFLGLTIRRLNLLSDNQKVKVHNDFVGADAGTIADMQKAYREEHGLEKPPNGSK